MFTLTVFCYGTPYFRLKKIFAEKKKNTKTDADETNIFLRNLKKRQISSNIPLTALDEHNHRFDFV